MDGRSRVLLRRSTGSGPSGIAFQCGCCGGWFAPRRVRMWLAAGDLLHGEICAECILRGPLATADRLRERIRERAETGFGGENRGAADEWVEWMNGRVRLLESIGSFPLAARQAAVRELRERR